MPQPNSIWWRGVEWPICVCVREWCYIIILVTFMIHESCVRRDMVFSVFFFHIFFYFGHIYFRIAITTHKPHIINPFRENRLNHACMAILAYTAYNKNNNNTPASQPQSNDAQIQYEFQLRNHIRVDRVSSTCAPSLPLDYISTSFMNVNWNKNKIVKREIPRAHLQHQTSPSAFCFCFCFFFFSPYIQFIRLFVSPRISRPLLRCTHCREWVFTLCTFR